MTASVVALPRPGSTLLTDEDRRIIALLAAGYTIKSAARRLEMNPATLGVHISRLLARTGTSNGTHLVATALRCGWLDGDDAFEAAA